MPVQKNKKLYLYKYRSFSSSSVKSIVADEVFFADPSSFNDPLDTRPTIEPDLPATALQSVLRKLIERREIASMRKAAKTIGYRGPNTTTRIEEKSKRLASSVLEDLKYHSTNPDRRGPEEEEHAFLLGHEIEKELLKRYAKGIYCLAERSSCPLMWSHYGDQHKGICIGYSVPDDARDSLFKVKYGGSRLVRTSDVAAMLAGDVAAKEVVNAAVLLRKAADWRYEREWRLLGERGSQRSPLELTSVTFGMRCPDAVQHAIIKALEGRDRECKFFEMREERGSFKLRRSAVDTAYLGATYPERARSALEGFEAILDSD